MKNKTYTKEQLIELYQEAEKKNGSIKSTKLEKYGLPSVNHYNVHFGSWNRFLIAIGKNVSLKKYRRKQNTKRFFTHEEYTKICNLIKDKQHLIQMLLIFHTGMRITEARSMNDSDIDFHNRTITIARKKTKTYLIDDVLAKNLSSYMSENTLPEVNPFGYPTIYGFNKRLKHLVKEAGIADYEDCSVATLRKTFYNGVLNDQGKKD